MTYAVCVPLERWRPVERWPDARAVTVDVLYTIISRVGVLPLFTFVLFYRAQVMLNGFLTDHGFVPPTLERLLPFLLGQPVLTFVLYAIILDCADYWRHRLSHRFGWWWALHSLHHAQRQMTFWSDDRNHVMDDLISALWFGVIALAIGVPPLQFPLLVLMLRFLESLSHANARVSFGWLGERLLISPRFHRAHHDCSRRVSGAATTARCCRGGTCCSAPPTSAAITWRPAIPRARRRWREVVSPSAMGGAAAVCRGIRGIDGAVMACASGPWIASSAASQ